MADENRGGQGDAGKGGNRRRRYYKRRPGERSENAVSGQEGLSAAAQSSDAPNAAAGSTRTGDARSGAPRGSGNQASQSGQSSNRSSGSSGGSASNEGRSRGVRKRRRSRSRKGDLRPETVVATDKDIDYVAPNAVYVYTHVVRPGTSGYEYRPEHFSQHGHTLDDYTVDLTTIFDIPRANYGVEVARAFDEMEERGDIATEARFQPWVEYIEGGEKPATSPNPEETSVSDRSDV